MKRVSMQLIAEKVGVSKYAVSKALAGKAGVSEATRSRIMEAASQLGYTYRPNLGVQASPAMSDKRVVAVVMPNVRLQTLDSDFWSLIIQGIGQALSRLSIGMLIITEQTAEHLKEILNPASLLGIIGVGEISASMLLEIQQAGIPIVLIDHEEPLVSSDSIYASNTDSMSLLTSYLIGLGHRSFMFLGDVHYSRSFMDRWTGFRRAVEDVGLAVENAGDYLPLPGNGREDNVLRIQSYLATSHTKGARLPTAWICSNDEIALSAIKVLKEWKLRIPEDVSVTGFDNIVETYGQELRLTTVHVRKEWLGERAVRALFDRLQDPNKPYEKVNVSCELMIRDTTQACTVQ